MEIEILALSLKVAPATVPTIRIQPFIRESPTDPIDAMRIIVTAAVVACSKPCENATMNAIATLNEAFMAYF